jgi:hypothetical protein|tara:strand:- start:3883 stop:4065 length:183 start_codon:yes stop_codon:yes gene_type:complete
MKEAVIKGLIILVPSWVVAYLTEKMVYVLPVVVVTGILSMAVIPEGKKRLDDDAADGNAE